MKSGISSADEILGMVMQYKEAVGVTADPAQGEPSACSPLSSLAL